MDKFGMGSVLMVGWFLLGAYLVILLLLSLVIAGFGLLRSWLSAARSWPGGADKLALPAVGFAGSQEVENP